jgi:hypothetical protein
MWSERFNEKTALFKVFDIVRNNEGLLSTEIVGMLPEVKKGTVMVCLNELCKKNLISKGSKLMKIPNGSLGFVYGINQISIQKRQREIESGMVESPYKFIRGKLKRKIVEFLKEQNNGFTPAEITTEIRTDSKQHTVMNTCNKLANSGIIKKSPFSIPNRIPDKTGNMSNVYGIDMAAVMKGIARLMPPAVREALIRIQSSSKVWPGWELTKTTKIDNYNLIQWFKQGLCVMGLVKYKTAGNITYYYNPRLPEDVVEKQLAEYREKSREWRLNITELGRTFQKRAIFVYVEYLRSKGYDIKTADGFPDFIPSWISPQTRKKYQVIKTDENGNSWTEYTNDVWKFDSEPIDCIIFVRDKNVDDKTIHVLTCKRDISKRYGVNYFSSFIGCVQMGRTKKGHDIPGFLTAKPVFICSEVYGKQLHTFNKDTKGQAGIILTMDKMKNILEITGKNYPNEEEFQRMVETKEGYDLYSNHEDVLLGEKTVFQMLKERGIWNDSR